ncbi:MAG: AmmeMemoRadiSam system protein B [Syntrophobacter sp.]
MAAEKIRESVIAGSWYPADPGHLKRQVSGYLNAASNVTFAGQLTGIISPHAGYVYSGPVAAYAYKLLIDNPFERIVILAPCHRAHFPGASVYNLGGFRTPLGVVPLDHELINSLFEQTPLVRYVPHADELEHSLEIQLPFLQSVLPRFAIAPVMMGEQGLETCRALADAIVAACGGKRVLLVASTDLSHYHPYEDARKLDRDFLDRIAAFDPEGLADQIKNRKCEACGAGPVVTLMLAARQMGADSAQVLHYANSGDVTGDKSSGVVGYMAAAVYRGKPAEAENPDDRSGTRTTLGYSPEEQETLRRIAYHAIRSRCLGEPMPEIPIDSPRLREPRGAFVCIHKGADLRGCIGMMEPHGTLSDTIRRMAVESAFGDPRFCPLTPEELDKVEIEISVLTPLQRISDPSIIEVGKHGLFLRKGFQSGILLPQVAVEHNWDRTQFLEWTCKKAGLHKDAWKDPETEIHIFSADVF